MRVLPLLLATTVCTPFSIAQGGLRIAGLDDPLGETPGWGQSSTQQYAALQHDENPGETTLLFVHTTIDASVAGPRVARGVFAVYPFLSPPANWTAADPALASLAASTTFVNPTEPLVIPPARIAMHLSQYLGTPLPATGYGTSNTGTAVLQRAVGPYAWPTGLPAWDERQAWSQLTWLTANPLVSPFAFDVVQLGRASVFQAAYRYVAGSSLPPLDDAAVQELAGILDQELGFEMHVQAVHVERPTAGVPRVRFSQRAVIRRRSLLEIVLDPWRMQMGAQRWVPSLLDHGIYVYLAGRAEYFHVLFPQGVSNLRAYVKVASGAWVTVQQIPNPVWGEGVLRPDIAVFPCPADATWCTAYFEDTTNPGVPVVPVRPFENGAMFWPFDPLPEHLPAQQP